MGDDDDDDYGHGGDNDDHGGDNDDNGGDNDGHGGDNDDYGGDRTKGIPGNCHMEMMMMEMMRLSAMPSTMVMRSFQKKFQAITIVKVFTVLMMVFRWR